MLALLLSASWLAGAHCFLDRSHGLSLLSLPELHSPLRRRASATGAGWRQLTPSPSTGRYPEVHDAHAFIGSTPHGFVVYNTTSITRHTTVLSDDYLALLASAELDCSPRAVPAGHEGQGHVQLDIAFPGGASDGEALEHLAARLALPGAVLVLGAETLLAHAALGEGGTCAQHVPSASPFFAVAALSRAAAGGGLSLAVSPAHPASAFAYLRLHLQHTPDGQAEVARRRAAGLYVGRELALSHSKSYNWGVNWNGNTVSPAAATPNLQLFPSQPGALYCANCYFFLAATLNLNLQICAIVRGALSNTYYDANNIGAPQTASAQTDCAALQVPDPSVFNAGMSAQAWFEGNAGFSFALMSSGVSGALQFPSGCAGPSATCTPEALPGVDRFTIPTLFLPVGGATITLDPTITLAVAGTVSLAAPNLNLQLGASASASIKLGGGVSFSGISAAGAPLNLQPAAFSTFNTAFSPLPFRLSGFTTAAGAIDVTLSPVIDLLVWKILPFQMVPSNTFLYALSRGGGCSGSASSMASASSNVGALGVYLKPVRTFPLIQTATGLSLGGVAPNLDVELVPQTTLLSPASASYSTAGAVNPAATGCVTVGTPVSSGGSLSAGPGSGAGLGAGSGLGAAGLGADFLTAAVLLAVLDPAQQAQLAATASGGSIAGAVVAPLVFLVLLLACTLPSQTLAPCPCCALPPPAPTRAPADTTAPWRDSAPTALYCAVGAAYLLLQGCTLLAAALGMPWSAFSPALTLGALGTGGQAACAALQPGAPLGSLPSAAAATSQCAGGTQVTAGTVLIYLALVPGVAAWAVAWAVAVRLRNAAHHAALPASPTCGNLPAAQAAGVGAVALALAGVATAWAGYNVFAGLAAPAVEVAKLNAAPPPGGVAAAVGLVLLAAGVAALYAATAVLAPLPLPHVSGESALSLHAVTGVPKRAPVLQAAPSSPQPTLQPRSFIVQAPPPPASPRSSPRAAAYPAPPSPASIQQQQQQQQQQPPLPAGWIERRTAEGLVFYDNLTLGTTQWARPHFSPEPAPQLPHLNATGGAAGGAGAGGGSGGRLPQGWLQRTSPLGRVLYVNPSLGMAQWARPGSSEGGGGGGEGGGSGSGSGSSGSSSPQRRVALWASSGDGSQAEAALHLGQALEEVAADSPLRRALQMQAAAPPPSLPGTGGTSPSRASPWWEGAAEGGRSARRG